MKPMNSDSERSWQPLTLILVSVAIPIAVIIRLIPYEDRLPNFALAGALFLFVGGRVRHPFWMVLPFIGMATVDLYFLGVKHWSPSPWVYGSYVVYLLLARWQLTRSESPVRIGAITLAGSLQFFLITNFGVWVSCVLHPELSTGTDYFYPATFAGLMKCYEMGLPFFRGTLLGDVVFSALLFGGHAVLARAYFPAEQVRRTEVVR